MEIAWSRTESGESDGVGRVRRVPEESGESQESDESMSMESSADLDGITRVHGLPGYGCLAAHYEHTIMTAGDPLIVTTL